MFVLVPSKLDSNRCEGLIQMSDHVRDRAADRVQWRGGQAAGLRMPYCLELPLSRHQAIQRYIFPAAQAQLAGIQAVAPIVSQQPRVNPVCFGLDPSHLAKGLDPLRVNHGPRNHPVRQRRFQVPFPATGALEHHEVLSGIELLNQSRNCGRIVAIPPQPLAAFR